jgi:hypothetical protein
MQVSTKKKLLRLAAGSIFAAGAVFVPAADAVAKAPPELPNLPTDPAEGLPLPLPGGDA